MIPSRTLVDQTVRELERWLSRPVGAYSGERKDVVTGGVMVSTYSSFSRPGSGASGPIRRRERGSSSWTKPITR